MEEDGYHVDRFPGGVRQDLLCSFCRNVPKDVRLCKNHDHFFCFAHISQYLQRAETCPVCREDLTPETLRRPKEFIKNSLGDLIISCDYHDRGCPEQVQLESLQNHVNQCEFAPARCENERCGMEMNKKDKEDHEKYFCQFGFARSHECNDIKASQDQIQEGQKLIMKRLNDDMKSMQDTMKKYKDETVASLKQVNASQNKMNGRHRQIRANQNEMNARLEQMTASQNETNARLEQMRANQNETNARLEQIRANQNETNARLEQMRASQSGTNATLEQMRASQSETNARLEQMRAGQDKMNASHAQIRANQDEMSARLKEMKAVKDEELNELKSSVTAIKRKQNEVGATVKKLKNDVHKILKNQGEISVLLNRQRWQESEDEDD